MWHIDVNNWKTVSHKLTASKAVVSFVQSPKNNYDNFQQHVNGTKGCKIM